MKESFFREVFPPPTYLTMPSVGLDVSDAAVHGIGLTQSDKGLTVGESFRREITPGLIVGGKIIKPKELIEELKIIKEEFDLQFVHVSLPERYGYVFPINIPATKRNEIRSILETKLVNNVPIPASEAVFDYTIIREEEWDGSSRLELGVSVYPREIVELYNEVFESAGLIPLRFEIEVDAIARSLVPEGDNSTYMIVDLGKRTTTLIIVSDGVVKFSSTIFTGGDALVSAIVKDLDVSLEEAERIKNNEGLIKSVNNSNQDKLFAEAESLRDEVRKHYEYWNSHYDSNGDNLIEKVLLCGGNASTPGLVEFMENEIAIGVVLANIFVNVNSFDDYIPDIPFDKSLTHAVSMGLALDM